MQTLSVLPAYSRMCVGKNQPSQFKWEIQYLFYNIVGLFQVAYVDFGNMSNPKITDILRLTIGVLCRKVQHMNSTTQLQRKRHTAVKLESTRTIAETTFCPMIKLKLNATENFLRVLHVDDDACFLNISKQILEMDSKIEVEMVTSVDEALDNLKQFQYDVVISDYEMPEKNGLQFLKELKKIAKSPPFILFTGKEQGEVAVKAQSLGAFRYLNKNGDPEHVYPELVSFIEQAAHM
jgi:CheY-like chemotaxis protein